MLTLCFFAGVTGVGAIALVGGDVPALLSCIGSAGALGVVAKLSVAFPFIYHYLGGVRHLIWDKLPETYINNESVETSSYILLGTATALSVGLALL